MASQTVNQTTNKPDSIKNRALITGASGGIGLELAKIHAAGGGDLVLVARRLDVLEGIKNDLEKQYGIQVIVLAKDLTQDAAPQEIYDELNAKGIKIDYLINNAGFGDQGLFYQQDVRKNEDMIAVNVRALMVLTRLFLPECVARGSGRILNVASTAGFLPGPLSSVYYATKAFVVSFTEALSNEFAGTGVTITALCPGPVATGFAATANFDGSKLFATGVASAYTVALCGYRGMMKGKTLVFNDWKLKFLLKWIVPFLPRKLVLKISRSLTEKG